jgi:hypothetical protein
MAKTAVEKASRLAEFAAWVATHIVGDEKGEAQIFLDRLFIGFGHQGLKEAGATCEDRVKNNAGGTSFADLVWKPIVVIEMKKRGTDLAKHYRQAFDYWTRLVPSRPRYAVLCNFDQFWVYDFETQLDTPVDIVNVASIASHYGPLSFLFPDDVRPVFGNHQETVTREAADKLATCFNSLVERGIERPLAQRFVLQILMALFAEDIGLLDKYFLTTLLEQCHTPQDSYDLIGGLFEAMNNRHGNDGGRFKGVAYFNGGLFAAPARIELTSNERALILEASHFDWSKVRPEIFGAIFEHSLGKAQRHATGAHFTNPIDIMKIVGPTIVEPWRIAIESAKGLGEMQELLSRMERFTVLDPACGSGNFLYTAYRELKRLEALLYERMAERFPKSVNPLQRPFGFVSARNFKGMDINPFAVDIAKVTMMLAHKLSIDELHINEQALPLDNLDENIIVCDALLSVQSGKTNWPQADVIIGNPPFLGYPKMKPELGTDYVNRLRDAYPEVPGKADFCVYWFRQAHDALSQCGEHDKVIGRAGLVGTQNIRNNASRIGGLDYIVLDGTIIEAVECQPWSGEAAVHVSIACWVKTQLSQLLPKRRRIWFKSAKKSSRLIRPKGSGQTAKDYDLDMKEVQFINSGLSDRVDVSSAATLPANFGFCYTGQYPRYNPGFIITPEQAQQFITVNPRNADVMNWFAGGKELLSNGRATRYSIDFRQMSILEAQGYSEPFNHVRRLVLPYVAELAETERANTGKNTGQDQGWLNTWWRYFRPRSELLSKIAPLKRYLVCSRVTTRPIFLFLTTEVRPSDALTCFALDDDYSFGILQSSAHYAWFHAKCSNMKSDPRYTSESIFDTFPWPASPTDAQIREVAQAGRAVRKIRSEAVSRAGVGLRELYGTLDLPGVNPLKAAHAALDTAVLAAYGFSAKKDILQQLLDLNTVYILKLGSGSQIGRPGIPPYFEKCDELVSADHLGL